MKPEPSLPTKLESPPLTKPDGEDYRIVTTGCQYCVVGCGYEAHVWKPGTPDVSGNGRAEPPVLEQGHWVSPAMTENIFLDGEERMAAMLPDPKCPLNRGNHSPRGGTQGRDLVGPVEKPDGTHPRQRDSVRERITSAYVRTRNGYEPVETEDAIKMVARLVRAATDAHSEKGSKLLRFRHPQGLGVKLFEYQYLENTYMATKLFYQLIGTPNVAFHDRPSVASNTEGFNDSGIDPHGYAYEDVWDSDVIFLIGINPYESQSVFFMQAMAGKRLIVLDPRRTITADYAEKTGGLHLQPTKLGSDVAVLNALCRHIRDRRRAEAHLPEDQRQWSRNWNRAGLFNPNAGATVTPNPNDGPAKERKAHFQMTPAAFEQWLDWQPTLEVASALSGIALARLQRAARWLSGPPESEAEKPSNERKVSVIFEKGVIWGFSYHGAAAVANLGLYLGSTLDLADASGQPEPKYGITGRAGGHQKGWCEVRYHLRETGSTDPKKQLREQGYPFLNASDAYLSEDGTKEVWRTHHYLDAHLVGSDIAGKHERSKHIAPDVNLLWLIGSNAAGQMANAQAKWAEISRRRGTVQPATAEEKDVVETLRERMRKGGLVVVQQDIYPNPTTAHADIILPASGWGEEDFTRFNGERRLRVYGRFQDPPKREGERALRCWPDWKIFREVAMRLIPEGWSGHGLPDGWEFSNGDKAKTSAKPPLAHGDFAKLTTTEEIFTELASDGGSNQSGSLKAIVSRPDGTMRPDGWRELQQLGSRGVVLPALRDAQDKLADSLRKSVKNDNDGNPPYAFLKADWRDIAAEFTAMQPRTERGEVAVCNGRINELWNSLFTHIRNETIRARYPDTAPGTIVEVAAGAKDADGHALQNGDVVELSCDDIRYAAAGTKGAFTAVVVVQPGVLPEGVVFAYFSWPAHTKRLADFPYREFNADGYVNNLTSGWTDPVNPIAAVKYARAVIRKTGRRFEMPTYAPRSIAFDKVMVADESQRLHWKVRELVVQRALPMVRYHQDSGGNAKKAAPLMLEPDEFIRVFGGLDEMSKRMRAGFVSAAVDDWMQWDAFTFQWLTDEQKRWTTADAAWTAKEKQLLLDWQASLDGPPPPPPAPIT